MTAPAATSISANAVSLPCSTPSAAARTTSTSRRSSSSSSIPLLPGAGRRGRPRDRGRRPDACGQSCQALSRHRGERAADWSRRARLPGSSTRDRWRIGHMIDAAEAALRSVEGRVREDLDRDEQLTMALTRLPQHVRCRRAQPGVRAPRLAQLVVASGALLGCARGATGRSETTFCKPLAFFVPLLVRRRLALRVEGGAVSAVPSFATGGGLLFALFVRRRRAP